MTEDQIWIIVGVVVVILVLRALTVRRVNGSAAHLQGIKNSSRSLKSRRKSGIRTDSISDAGTVEAVRQMLEGGRFIEAVKYVRETKGIGLKEAKLFVESVQNNQVQKPSSKANFSSTEIATRAKHLRDGGHKIEAIKYVQDHTQMDLVTAKRFVESL